MKKRENRYEWVDIDNFIVYDNVTKKEMQCYEKRKCIDDTNKEFEPKFLIKELCNKEFIMWSINSSKFAKKLNFKDDYSASKFSKYIYISKEYIDNDLCFKLISRSSKFISKIPNVLLTDEIIEYALNKNIRILGNIPQERRTQERCKYAVSKNGLTLLYVPDYLKTLDICTDAVLENPKAIKYVPIRLLNNSFLKHIISLGVKIDKENYDYINSCLKFHENKCSEELLSENVILTYDSSINVPIDQLVDFFSLKSLKLLKNLKIYTLSDFLIRVTEEDFMLLLGNNIGVINEIYAALRLLKCKYFNCDPHIDMFDDNLLLKDICDLLGLSTSVYNHLAMQYNIYSAKSLFDFLQSDDVYEKMIRIKSLGDINIRRVLSRTDIIINYYKNRSDYKKKVLNK